jgi:DNA polymerase-3 subunit gamma/tau
MYQVLARKWRPQNFDEVVGQAHVTRTLGNAIETDRLAHAYIFAGIRGTGKTTVARVLAKCLNCEQRATPSPCSDCTSCREIADSRSMDVLELDAASRTGVDNIRELQEVISYAPVRDRYKILIIDEAHMLSKAAFNALLKTLEEPPPNVIFVLATTELQKVLPTILSRCQVFEFRRVGVRELTDHLRRVCDAEKIGISDGALERIARAGEGSVRDSLSVLERVLAFSGDQVEDEDVLRMLGGVRVEVLARMMRGLAARDAGAMLRVLDELLDEGHDLLHFWTELISALRDLMLLRAAPDEEEMLARSPEEARALAAAATDLSDEDLSRVFQILAELETGLKASTQPRFLFEAALIRLAGLGAVRPIEQVLQALRDGEPPPPASPPAQKKKSAVEPRRTAEPPAPRPGGSAHGGSAAQLIRDLSDAKPMLGVVLEEAARVSIEGTDLHVEFDAGKEAMVRQLQRTENLDLLKRHATRLAGGPVTVRIDAAPGEPASVPAPPVRAAAAKEPAAGVHSAAPGPARRPARSGGRKTRGALLESAKQEPGVKKLMREFGAQVVDVRPLAPAIDPVLDKDDNDSGEEDP